MDKLIEKIKSNGKTVYLLNDDEINGVANITKEVACGFAHYLYVNYKLNPHKETTFYRPNEWFIGSNRPMNDGFTIDQVFNFYIKSL